MIELSRSTKHVLISLSLAVVGITAMPPVAHALQGGEDPSLLPVLIDKRFGNRGRHQLALQGSTAMASKFVESHGAYLTYGYNFNDLLGLEIGGGYLLGAESNIMKQVRENLPATVVDGLSDLYQLEAMGHLDFVLVPLYGKISFASEVDPGYDLFLLAGAGAGRVRRLAGDGSGTFDYAIAPIFNFGLGLRFYFNRYVALRAELRDYFFPEPTEGETGMTFNLHFQGGLQFQFGGE